MFPVNIIPVVVICNQPVYINEFSENRFTFYRIIYKLLKITAFNISVLLYNINFS